MSESLSGQSVVVLTGAGISAESGLKTFRDNDGLWEGHSVEEVASPEAFVRQPEVVLEFYNQRRRQLLSGEVHPNLAHKVLAAFEKHHDGEFTLITQNVDNLHELAGSQNLLHLHGELLQARCVDTGEVFDWRADLTAETPHPKRPEKLGRLRPNIVWFGEMPFYLDEIQKILDRADVFVAIGTSGVVYPAAGFVQWTPSTCRRVLINLEDTGGSALFDEVHLGPASKKTPEFFNIESNEIL